MGYLVNGQLLESNNLPNGNTIAAKYNTSTVSQKPANTDAETWRNVCSIPIGEKLSAEEVFKLRVVLLKNVDAFQWDPEGISRTHLIEHEIDTGDAKPIKTTTHGGARSNPRANRENVKRWHHSSLKQRLAITNTLN